MRLKKICFSTRLSDLYGRDKYDSHIEVGKEYWYYFADDSEAFKFTHKHWNKIRVTYIRSGCLFYVLSDAPEVKEDFCPTKCYMASSLVLAELNPIKDLKDLKVDIDSELAKLMYRFSDEHTVIKDWPNETEIDVDEEEMFKKFGSTEDWLLIKTLEVK